MSREIMQQALTVLKAWDAVAWRTLDTIEGLEAALAQPEQDISYTDIQMAELIMSDCGHSSDYTPLLNRIAGRLATYRQALAQPEQAEWRKGFNAGYETANEQAEFKEIKQTEALEPIAWITDNYEQDRSATTFNIEVAKRWKEKGWRVAPLYALDEERA